MVDWKENEKRWSLRSIGDGLRMEKLSQNWSLVMKFSSNLFPHVFTSLVKFYFVEFLPTTH